MPHHKTLKRQRYLLALTEDPETTLEVEVTPADQLRAEVEGQREGVNPAETPIAFTLVCIHRALVRLGLYTGKYQQLVAHDLYEWEPVTAAAGGVVPVDPTPSEEPTPAPSSSPTTSAAGRATGSTPPSTSGS